MPIADTTNRRVDALPGKRPAFAVLGSAVLAPAPDAELQTIVDDTAEQLGMPMGLISLVLEHVQLVKAHHGLPAEVVAGGAVPRDEAFCQFAVRSFDVFQIPDTTADPALPQELVERYGIRSYLGAPVEIQGEPVGTLCVMDVRPRRFDRMQRELIEQKAGEASARMAELAAADPPPASALRDRAMRPQFAELRNRLQPIYIRLTNMQIAAAEIRAVHRTAEYVSKHPDVPATSVRFDAGTRALEDLATSLDALHGSMKHLARAVAALEAASLVGGSPCTVREIVDSAITLAHHDAKLVGGVHLPATLADTSVLAPRAIAVSSVAAVLSCISRQAHLARMQSGIGLAVVDESITSRVHVTAEALEDDALRSTAASLDALVRDAPYVHIEHTPGAVDIVFTRV